MTQPLDPHQSKIDPNDPRLHLRRVRGRTLKKGPAIALVAGVLAVIVVAVTLALQAPAPAGSGPKQEPAPTAPAQPAVAPAAIRNGEPSAIPSEPSPSLRSPRRKPSGGAAAVGSSSGPDLARRQALHEQDWKAAGAGILFEVRAGDANGPALGPAGAPAPASPMPSALHAASGPGADDPNLQERKNAFLDTQGSSKTTDYLLAMVQHPRSPYELKAGTIIPVVLITGINSDLPGPVIGQVRENVYDTVTGNTLLVPQGARLLAAYDSMVAWGQERVLLCWNRLIFPNGDSVNLQCMPAGDLQGAAGLTDDVNEHWWRILKGAAVASLLAASSQALAGNQTGFAPTVPQMWATGAAGQVNQVGQQITRRNIEIQPTITVRPGFSVNVIVTKDIVLSPYSVK